MGAGANRKSFRPSGCGSGLPDRKLVPVPYQTLVRIFEKDGFSLARQEGDHKIFTKVPRSTTAGETLRSAFADAM